MAQSTARCKGFIHPSISPMKTCNCSWVTTVTLARCPFSHRATAATVNCGHFYRATIFCANRRATAALLARVLAFRLRVRGQRRRRVYETRKKTINPKRRAKCVSSDGHISRGLFDASSASASFNRCALARSSAVPQKPEKA